MLTPATASEADLDRLIDRHAVCSLGSRGRLCGTPWRDRPPQRIDLAQSGNRKAASGDVVQQLYQERTNAPPRVPRRAQSLGVVVKALGHDIMCLIRRVQIDQVRVKVEDLD